MAGLGQRTQQTRYMYCIDMWRHAETRIVYTCVDMYRHALYRHVLVNIAGEQIKQILNEIFVQVVIYKNLLCLVSRTPTVETARLSVRKPLQHC
jgi:hypothetical protein